MSGLKVGDIDYHATLSVYAGYPSFDALERTTGDTHDVVRHKTALTYIYLHNVLIAYGGCADEQFHRL